MNNSDPLTNTSPLPCSQVLKMFFPYLILGNGLIEVLLFAAFKVTEPVFYAVIQHLDGDCNTSSYLYCSGCFNSFHCSLFIIKPHEPQHISAKALGWRNIRNKS